MFYICKKIAFCYLLNNSKKSEILFVICLFLKTINFPRIFRITWSPLNDLMEPGNSHVDSGKYEGGAIIALYIPKYSILKCISGA